MSVGEGTGRCAKASCLRNGKAGAEFTSRMSNRRIQRRPRQVAGNCRAAPSPYWADPTVWGGNTVRVGSEVMNWLKCAREKACVIRAAIADNFRRGDIRHLPADKDLHAGARSTIGPPTARGSRKTRVRSARSGRDSAHGFAKPQNARR